MLVFMLHVKLACVKLILPCDIVVGNVIVFVIEFVVDFIFHLMLLCVRGFVMHKFSKG